jgi:hypothetical protein
MPIDVHSAALAGTFAARNPLEPTRMVLVVAGNSALRTVKLPAGIDERKPGEYLLVDGGKAPVAGFIKALMWIRHPKPAFTCWQGGPARGPRLALFLRSKFLYWLGWTPS